ncbi:inositol phosphorylceramide synthase [Nocardioides euryhalodurans]|uniref:Inositol phosphorylceramide synthase n=2 Tax=Nocardioides euryhalodurans TaxID=2518370 RepID=A0A4V1BEF4_9ACTN|nr:inositol phosphorylceramide synthase [Nocardioides euryhalodurans]
MGLLAIVAALVLDKRLADPDGFLGPSWLRLPLLLSGAFLADIVPRTLWLSRGRPGQWRSVARERIRDHWTRERLTLVVMGIVCFYITYVSYRNLKSFLPFIMGDKKYDYELHLVDQALMLGNEPADVLHAMLGTDVAAHFLSSIYLWFLPLVPLAVTAWLVWSRNISYGYWFVTSQVIAWTLGTLSYYMLPTLGPGFAYPWLYEDLASTPTNDLMDALFNSRVRVTLEGVEGAVQSTAGFASLHTAITLLVALMVQYTVRSRVVHWIAWVNFGLTIAATLYFGWHYIADDVAGILIALLAFYLGGIASGQKFERHGLASHPTTTTSAVPVEAKD